YPLVGKVYEYYKEHQLYHKKVATFDDTHMMIGTFNLGSKSAKFDHEIAFVIKDPRVTKECKRVLKEDAKQSTKLTGNEIATASIWTKFLGFVISTLTKNLV